MAALIRQVSLEKTKFNEYYATRRRLMKMCMPTDVAEKKKCEQCMTDAIIIYNRPVRTEQKETISKFTIGTSCACGRTTF